MGAIRSTVGLASGIDSGSIINSLITLQSTPIIRLQNRITDLTTTQTGLKTLEASLLTLSTSIQDLAKEATFNALNIDNTDSDQLTITADKTATQGTYQFRTLRTASTFSSLSRGYANSDTTTVGTGQLVIQKGGFLDEPTTLDALNAGNGVRRGKINITDRSGASATIDLSATQTIDDVLDTINNNSSISVTASTDDDGLVLTDTSGSTSTNLTVIDLNGGFTAEDLGIEQSVSSSTLTGDSVYTITGDFTLGQINDGNEIRLLNGAPDIKITLTDDSTIEVNLDGSATINDIIAKINDNEDNAGKVTATIENGALKLVDNTGGGGSSALQVEDINDSNAVRQLGLDATAAGTTLTGNRLIAGLNSVLIRNLRGGQGIDQLGQISVTDRQGFTATLDLTNAESLDEVVQAINGAEDGSFNKLALTATINANGNGIVITDSSGASASNLVIADVGGSTLAAQLGITIDSATTSVESNDLDLRHVNSATSLSDYAPDGSGIEVGSIKITDSQGNEAVVDISGAVKNVGDVIQRINAATGISVTAQLNETGDGFIVIDEAGGAAQLKIEDQGSTTAADLRILGTGTTGTSGKSEINSRFAAIIDVASTDSLDDIVKNINDAVGFVSASVLNDGSSITPFRLSLTSGTSGAGGRILIDDGGLNLGLNNVSKAQDALLQVGANIESAFVKASSTNSFSDALAGIDVDVKSTGTSNAEVTITIDSENIKSVVEKFVKDYNSFISQSLALTKFTPGASVDDPVTRGPLQGQGIVFRLDSRLQSLVTKIYPSTNSTLQSLAEIGIRLDVDGKLTINEDRLDTIINEQPEDLANFFLADDTGFAALAKDTVDTFTDSISGSFTIESKSLQSTIDLLNSRVGDLQDILDIKKDQLIRQFANMETIISQLQSQQNALSSILSFG